MLNLSLKSFEFFSTHSEMDCGYLIVAENIVFGYSEESSPVAIDLGVYEASLEDGFIVVRNACSNPGVRIDVRAGHVNLMPAERDRMLLFSRKWDGCMNVSHRTGLADHFCDPWELEAYTRLLLHLERTSADLVVSD